MILSLIIITEFFPCAKNLTQYFTFFDAYNSSSPYKVNFIIIPLYSETERV